MPRGTTVTTEGGAAAELTIAPPKRCADDLDIAETRVRRSYPQKSAPPWSVTAGAPLSAYVARDVLCLRSQP